MKRSSGVSDPVSAGSKILQGIQMTGRNTFWIVSLILGVSLAASSLGAQTALSYEAAPPDNPLKGLVPYAGTQNDRFPHSMEFSYIPLSELVVGEAEYDWRPLEKLMNDIASRRHQTIFRVWMEYPGHRDGIPAYLEKQGVKVTQWMNTNTAPFPQKMCRTPDYGDPRVRKMMTDFIAALGRTYDGDPRIGFITAGLLGTWGEWHTYPRNELMADKRVQSEVMDAYEAAFKKTPILFRYPAGKDDYTHAANHLRPFGYHDDSFAWATLDTGRKEDRWFFVPSLNDAGRGAVEKWEKWPIGGEIRPELWGDIFDERPRHPKAQDFAECVRQTHVTWLMDTGMFRETASPDRFKRALKQVRRMGYEFHVAKTCLTPGTQGFDLQLQVENRGVAPFYHGWIVELGFFTEGGKQPLRCQKTDWSLLGILPGEPAHCWQTRIPVRSVPQRARYLAVRVVNPLPNGLPLIFANSADRQIGDGWLRVAEFSHARVSGGEGQTVSPIPRVARRVTHVL